MALRIVKANEPIKVDRLNICIYAPPGVGKSTLGFSADDPLMLDFDKGAYRALGRKDSVPIDKWDDVAGMNAADWQPYRTCLVDTAGRALDKLSFDIIAENSKMGRKDGSLTLQGFGSLKGRFSSWMKLLNSFGVDVVMICHMDEQRNGDDIIERLDAQGSSKNEIYKSADAMGRIFIRQGKRFLDFSPRDGSFGKNPGQLPELEIPHPNTSPLFLASVIAQIKTHLNQLSEEQLKAQQEIEKWTEAINDCSDLKDFNSMVTSMKKAPDAAKMYLHGRAKQHNFQFNRAAGFYEAIPSKANGQPQQEVLNV